MSATFFDKLCPRAELPSRLAQLPRPMVFTIESSFADELKKLDAGYNFRDESGRFPWRGKGVRIATLAEVIADALLASQRAGTAPDIGAPELLARQYDEVGRQLGTSEVLTDVDQLRKLGRELARLEPVERLRPRPGRAGPPRWPLVIARRTTCVPGQDHDVAPRPRSPPDRGRRCRRRARL